jgi:hypothetical protein
LPRPIHLYALGTCPITHYARLAVVSTDRSARSASWTLLPADPGCSFEAATFDPAGIAAVEGCRQRGNSASYVDPGFGTVWLVQLDPAGRISVRVALQPGWEDGVIATEPSGRVLLTQDQPANEPYPERDWVWEFDGRTLRLIRHYAALDADEILAIPYR